MRAFCFQKKREKCGRHLHCSQINPNLLNFGPFCTLFHFLFLNNIVFSGVVQTYSKPTSTKSLASSEFFATLHVRAGIKMSDENKKEIKELLRLLWNVRV